jgi:arginine N-succinyltransferase
MFVIRQAVAHDLDDLHALAKQTYFINLPPDRDIIAAKIAQSQASFRGLLGRGAGRGQRASHASHTRSGEPAHASSRRHHGTSGLRAVTGQSDLFLLVLEDVTGRGVIGTSQVIARMGGKDHPRVFMRLSQASRRSETLKIEWTHTFAQIDTDPSGPTEIGGLILNHAFRGHRLRLGRFLSFARFHLIGLFRQRFAPRVVAEMLGPIDKNGYNPFFERFMRQYIPRSFAEVYRFSQTSKEFVTGLMPEGPIDISILDAEVTHAAGEVSDETRPARHLLERLGFRYHQQIDPLDGGPHLEAPTGQIVPIAQTRRAKALSVSRRAAVDTSLTSLASLASPTPRSPRATPTKGPSAAELRRARLRDEAAPEPTAIVSSLNPDGEFRAVQTRAHLVGERVVCDADVGAALDASGAPPVVGFTPLDRT